MMTPYHYTPPNSAGMHWDQPQMVPRHNSFPSTTLPYQNTQNQHSMYAAMASVMQQMQHSYSQQQNNLQQDPQPQQQTPPVYDQSKLPTPQPSDNALLAQIIYEQTKRGLTYKAALESLHGHNEIMAFSWKDYFLENKEIIDALVDQLRGRAQSTSTVPIKERSSSPLLCKSARDTPVDEAPQSRKHAQSRPDTKSRSSVESSASVTRSVTAKGRPRGRPKGSSARLAKEARKQEHANGKSRSTSVQFEADAASRRTLNSMSSAPSDDLLAKVPPAVAIDAYTGLPAAPSRSPSPPAAPPNSRYTEQDAIYFYRRIAYDLARNPNLSKANLCDILGEKAPHHTGVAWRSYWHKHEDVADKMYLLTQLVDQDREKAIQSWRGGGNAVNGNSRPRTISYKESSDSDAGEEDPKAGFSSESEEESSDDEDENGRLDTDENEKLGVAGSMFTMAEYRVLAKHIAICPDWFNGYRDWEPFTIAYPQRTTASWREIYRRKQDEIDALARRYMKKARKTRERISAQRGRPSWARQNPSAASSSVAGSTGSVKRRYSEDDLREQLKEKKSKFDD